ncbi:hypothetical protein IFM89_030648 [Coptis chinensis]|uniref:Reticulon-like protein n=1 Tax=Coptis chinensis TaxID=261450 RepID=A0A835IF95_9MAGN|nr:hypothetical protein IFM89_030648 [Coptis chinensis]
MQVGRTGRTSTPKNGVVGGSVLDRRMKIDEGKSEAKVMNREDNSENSGGGSVSFRAYGRSRRIQNATDVIDRSSIQIRKEKIKPMQLRKTKSDIREFESEKKPMHKRKTKSALDKRVSEEEASVSGEVFEKNQSETPGTRSDSYNCNELGVCIEKLNSSTLRTEEQIEIEGVVVHDEGADADEEDEGEEEDEDEVEEIELEIEEQSFDVKEVDIQQVEHKKVVNEENNKVDLIRVEKPLLIFSNVIRPSPQVSYYARINPESTKAPPVWDEFERLQETQSKLQNIVDLVMWKDVPKSAFVFGLGSFFLLSSSFTKDLNFSLISAVSYVGLFYLAATFFYKSILCRGSIDVDEESNQRYLVGEEEAIWLLHLILPYFNGFLLKLKGLFSGDPATTLKLAVTLFILARCGGSITVWKMAKLGFFAVFTVPKVCSSYSTQLTAYGNFNPNGYFWIRRFCDAWNSCKHKKAVAAAIFTLVWNLSSVSARVWAAFMLVVAIRYYQQSLSMLREEWEEEQARGGETMFGRDNIHIHHSGPNLKETIKEKKGS